MTHVRRYRYVGPVDLRDHAPVNAVTVEDPATLVGWLTGQERDLPEPFTFVVTLDGFLKLAPRRSEHVTLAGGHEVLAAGEMTFVPADSGWHVVEVTNQSTGYCPDPDSWPAVATALERLSITHPGDYTSKIVFRRCPACGERNIVRDDDFTCALCEAHLPEHWNITPE